MASPPASHLRLDIQGLRAIAVIGVVLFHVGLILPGGFVGVDIFFVISGFVITLTLLRVREKTGKNIDFNVNTESDYMNIFVMFFLPVIFLVAMFWLMNRRMSGMGGGGGGYGGGGMGGGGGGYGGGGGGGGY